MSTGLPTQSASDTRPGAAPPLVLAAALACAVLGVAAPALRGTAPRLAAVRPVASHGPAALDAAHVLRVYDEVDRRARGLPPDERARVARAILEEATHADLAPALVLAVIHVESGFRHRAASPAGALGLMQLKPSTLHAELSRARIRGADPLDPVANVRAGVRYLGRLVRAFKDEELALVAYNAGPRRLRRHLEDGEVPERLLRYAHLVRSRARSHQAAARSARPAAPRLALALAPAHGDKGPRAPWSGAAGVRVAPPVRVARVLPSAWMASASTSRPGVRLLEPDWRWPPLRRGRRDADPPRDALAWTPFRSRHPA